MAKLDVQHLNSQFGVLIGYVQGVGGPNHYPHKLWW